MHKKLQTVSLMILLIFVSQACTDIFMPALPSMTHEFNTDLTHMNKMLSVYIYGQAFFCLFVGVLSDLFGRRLLLISASIALIISSFIIPLIDQLNYFFLWRLVQAFGSSALYIVLRLVIRDTMDIHEQVNMTGLLVLGLFISPAIAPVLGAHLIEYFGWRGCFYTIAILMLGLLIWLFKIIPETNNNIAKYRQDYSLVKHIGSYYIVFKNRFLLMLMCVVGGTYAAYYAFIAISSYVFIEQFHVSHHIYAYSFIIIALCYFIGNRIMVLLNRAKINQWMIIKYGVVISIVGLVIMVFAGVFISKVFFILAFLTLGIGFVRLATALIITPVHVMVINRFERLGAQATGVLTCSQYIFAGIGSEIVVRIPSTPHISLIITSMIFTMVSIFGFYNLRKRGYYN